MKEHYHDTGATRCLQKELSKLARVSKIINWHTILYPLNHAVCDDCARWLIVNEVVKDVLDPPELLVLRARFVVEQSGALRIDKYIM